MKSYSPWGDGAGQGTVGPRFNGEHWDEASGSYLLGNGYRAYSSRLVRFTAPDSWSPFGAGGINAYAYCDGDPINFSDPSGHISGWGWASIIVGGIGLLLAPLTFSLSLKFGVGVALVLTALEAASVATAIISGALEEKNLQASEQYGWVSLGLGAPSAVMGIFSLGKAVAKGIGALKSAPIKLSGKMRELDLLIDGLYTFEDTYKKGIRFNIVAHGLQLVIKTAGGFRNMDVDELVSILKSECYNFDNYSNIRILSYYSGVDEENYFGYRLGQQMKKVILDR
nr:RHS repeat-associated core domain-containing protein [Arsenophonus endosymbiont of Aleurodicus floccissimus]